MDPSQREAVTIHPLVTALWRDERGQDLVEYVALALIVSGVVAVALLAFRGQVQAMFADAAQGIADQS